MKAHVWTIMALISISNFANAQIALLNGEYSPDQLFQINEVQKAYYCGSLFSRYGHTEHYTQHLRDAGEHLTQLTDKYADQVGMNAEDIELSKTLASSLSSKTLDDNMYIDYETDAQCIMIYRGLDTLMSDQQYENDDSKY